MFRLRHIKEDKIIEVHHAVDRAELLRAMEPSGEKDKKTGKPIMVKAYEEITEKAAPSKADDNDETPYEEMSKADLQELCTSREIEFTNANTKAQLIALLSE